jgi:hypothetical protein
LLMRASTWSAAISVRWLPDIFFDREYQYGLR